jgi:hypothetical protein
MPTYHAPPSTHCVHKTERLSTHKPLLHELASSPLREHFLTSALSLIRHGPDVNTAQSQMDMGRQHTHRHIQTHTDMMPHIYAYKRECMHAYIHIFTHTAPLVPHVHTYIHTHIHTQCICTYMQYACMYAYACMHMHVCISINVYIYTYMCICMCTCKDVYMHLYSIHTHKPTHIPAHTNTHTNTHTQTRASTRTYIYTYKRIRVGGDATGSAFSRASSLPHSLQLAGVLTFTHTLFLLRVYMYVYVCVHSL